MIGTETMRASMFDAKTTSLRGPRCRSKDSRYSWDPHGLRGECA